MSLIHLTVGVSLVLGLGGCRTEFPVSDPVSQPLKPSTISIITLNRNPRFPIRLACIVSPLLIE